MIFLDTNVISETLRKSPSEAVISWLVRHDAEIALPTVTIAEIAYAIQKIMPDRRAARLEQALSEWRRRFAGRIFGLTEEAAIAYGEIGRGLEAGAHNVGPGRHDRRHRTGEWRTSGDPQYCELSIDGARPRFAVGLLI
ncbi:putative nucleic acid-binding protein [Sinorhizobium fredii]